jgi:hypothetical protein
MSEQQREVYRQFRNAQDKYTYFLLAATGAAVALALRETENAALMWSQVPLAAAVLCWGLSFFFGCRHLGYMASSLYSNFELLKVEAGQHPLTGTHPEKITIGSEVIREAIERDSSRAVRYGQMQFALLILGATLYIGWHVWEMWLRTIRREVVP